jgi:hypothetical protein
MSANKIIVSDLLSSKPNPLEPNITPATNKPTSPGNLIFSKIGGTSKIIANSRAKVKIGSRIVSEMDSMY